MVRRHRSLTLALALAATAWLLIKVTVSVTLTMNRRVLVEERIIRGEDELRRGSVCQSTIIIIIGIIREQHQLIGCHVAAVISWQKLTKLELSKLYHTI